MKKIYLAGKVTGEPRDKVEKKFKEAEKTLSEMKYVVINPLTYIDEKMSWNKAMRKALQLLSNCDEIALLPDWRQSKGAQMEYFNAIMLEMPTLILLENPLEPVMI